MEVWLKNDNESFRFPVLPSTIKIEGSGIVNIRNITNLGDVSLFGGKGLRNTEISSFFPNQVYTFTNYNDFPAPYECVNTIEKWMNEGVELRFIVTETPINIPVLIESFNYKEQDGTRDVYFSIFLREYRKITIDRQGSNVNTGNNNRPNENASTEAKMYIVQAGDNLWNIAQANYGSGSSWGKIVENNKNKYPSLVYSTIIQPGWELIL